MKLLTAFVLGITLTLALLYAVSGSAQSGNYDAAYARRAARDIGQIEAAYDVTRYYWRVASTVTMTEARQAYTNLVTLSGDLVSVTVPVPATGVHQQIAFTAVRCRNYAITVNRYVYYREPPTRTLNYFEDILEANLREFCAVQIQGAKLRLIDYGVANGVNPFAK